MPKLKTNRAARKRFRKTGTGRFRRNKASLRHLLTSKSRKRKRHLRSAALVSPADSRGIGRLLPYG